MTPSQNWIFKSEHGSSMAIHGQAWASTGWARASTSKFWWIFRFWAFGARYHRFCEEFMKGTDTLQNLDFGEWERLQHGHSRVSMSKQRLSTSKHEQARANFGIFRFWAIRARYHRFCKEFIIGTNDTFQKLDFEAWARLGHRLSTSKHRLSTSKHRLSTSEHEQILKFSDFGRFELYITDFV